MKTIIEKPIIPILFIDTFFFIDLIQNKHNQTKTVYYEKELQLIDLIQKLTKEMKLICPVGDQEEEYELGSKYKDEIRDEQVSLALGIRANYHYAVYKMQTQLAIKAFLSNVDSLTYTSWCLFERDIRKQMEEQLKQSYIVSVHLPFPAEMLDKTRKTKTELALEFEKMRIEKQKMKVKYEDWVNQEQLGSLEAAVTTLKSVLPKKLTQQPLSEADRNGLSELGDILSFLSHYKGSEATLEEAIKFLKSEYFSSIPYISVQSKLYASMWRQSGPIKESDNFDFHQASQMLPYSAYYLTDSSLKHRITSNPLMLDKEYGVIVYSMKDVDQLIGDLEKL